MKNEKTQERPGRAPATLRALSLLGAALLLAACASSGMKRSERTTSTMKTVDDDVRQTVEQVDATNAALRELIRPGNSNPKKAFDKYSTEASRMEDRGKRLVKHTDEMIARRSEYFSEWEKEGNTYSNPEIRALSEQRRADLGEVFARIPAASVGVKGAIQTYLSDIKEIQTFLSNDLTPKGIESITPAAEKSIEDGENLKQAVKPMVAAIDNARAEMAQRGPK